MLAEVARSAPVVLVIACVPWLTTGLLTLLGRE